jgi:hypothetical protein
MESRQSKTRALARQLLNDWEIWWVVPHHFELALTNNVALRHWVNVLRISHGIPTA